MSPSAVLSQPAFILQQRPYRESSVLLEVLTLDYGIVSILARGVRKEKSKTAGLLLPFSLLSLSYLDKNELKILTHVECCDSYPLQKLSLYCGFYLNELLQRFLFRHDPHPQLFVDYQKCLHSLLHEENIEQCLRYFELNMLTQTGYALQLDVDRHGEEIAADQRYDFMPGIGFAKDRNGYVWGETLLLLDAGSALHGEALIQSKRLLRSILDQHLQGRPLKSRDVLAKMIKYL